MIVYPLPNTNNIPETRLQQPFGARRLVLRKNRDPRAATQPHPTTREQSKLNSLKFPSIQPTSSICEARTAISVPSPPRSSFPIRLTESPFHDPYARFPLRPCSLNMSLHSLLAWKPAPGPVYKTITGTWSALGLPKPALHNITWIPGQSPLSTYKEVVTAIATYLVIIFGGRELMR
jgi:hypothetical protein